jgi:hypothetical protein
MNAPSRPYVIIVFGPNSEIAAEADIDCASDREAALFAFSTASPCGHALRSERRFIGWFEAALSNEDGLGPEALGLPALS